MGHLLHKFRGQIDLVYIDPPFDSKADYVRKVELRGLAGKQVSGEDQSLLEQVQYNDGSVFKGYAFLVSGPSDGGVQARAG